MSVKKELFNTGNILTLNELKKKVGLNPSDELIEALKIVLSENDQNSISNTAIKENNLTSENVNRKDLKITIKIFISCAKADILQDALDRAFNVLQTDNIESLILAFDKSESIDDEFQGLQSLWKVIEKYIEAHKLFSAGVSDVDTDMFIKLFNWAKVKPNIIQINLDVCCVVPPALQNFTKENDIQLLTHNDPCKILPKDVAVQLFGNVNLDWVLRYQVHLKCRGVLSTKGYLIRINK